MIKMDTDETITDAEFELIEAFCIALVDKDTYAMKEVMYLVNQKLSSECVCLEETCICKNW